MVPSFSTRGYASAFPTDVPTSLRPPMLHSGRPAVVPLHGSHSNIHSPIIGGMLPTDLDAARDLLRKAVGSVRSGGVLSDSELRDALELTRELARLVSQVQVETVAALDRSGAFAAQGYRRPDSAVANMLTMERGRASEIIRAAARVCPRIDLQGQALPASLPATAAVFAAGAASLAHVEVIGRLLDGGAAHRLPPTVWAAVEELLAAHADEYTPTELRVWGVRLIDACDQDGPPPEADERPPVHVNELRLPPLRGGGVTLVGRFEDPVRAAAIRTVIDAKSAPLTAEDQRGTAERQADAVAEVMRFVLDHGDTILPSAGGERPRLNVHLQLPDLQNRARAGCLDFGDTLHPTALRELCCDAGVVPIVLGGAGQPLDVGQSRRTIPDGLRRAVVARDRGCAHPGCDRPPSWCQVHHVREWAKGGATRLDNLVMLCCTHHAEIHSTEWAVRIGRDGIPEFVPPLWVDRQQRPRRRPRIPAGGQLGTGPPGRAESPRPNPTYRGRRNSHARTP